MTGCACDVCGTNDPGRYVRCDWAGCPDGRDQSSMTLARIKAQDLSKEAIGSPMEGDCKMGGGEEESRRRSSLPSHVRDEPDDPYRKLYKEWKMVALFLGLCNLITVTTITGILLW